MASHVVAADSTESEKLSTLIITENGSGIGNYGLRENPKRSWRAVDYSSKFCFPNEKVCKQCGKGFQSLKALCGHMACHSEKDRNLNLDSDSDEDEMQNPSPTTRSRSKKFKKLVITNNNSNYYNGSSSVSEIDDLEQEDNVARCLMMLSKDTANWAGLDYVAESSDNNSTVLETKSSSFDMKIAKNERNSVEELIKNNSRVVFDTSTRKGFNLRELSYEEKLEIRRNLFNEFGYGDSLEERISENNTNSKRNKYKCSNCNKIFTSFQGLGGHRPCHKKNNTFSSSKHENEHENRENLKAKTRSKKIKGHECPICFRMFKSGQALGGHKRSHFINGSEERFDHMISAMENKAPTSRDMIDLNVPAMEED